MATLRDIANVVGINVSTVSRAINGNGNINEETKRKIIEVAKQLNYYSNKQNVALSASNSFSIGVISPDITSSFYSLLVEAIAKNLSSEGYTMINGFTNFNEDNEIGLVNLLAHKSVDGIIFINASNKRTQAELEMFKKTYGIPIVQVDTMEGVDFYDCITIDDKLGVFMAVEHFKKIGCGHIGYIGDEASLMRLEYFKDAMCKCNLPVDESIVKVGKERFEEGGYLRMKEILKKGELPKAVFASYDDIAIGAMKAADEHGIKVPDDISFIGYDNIRVSGFLQKALTTVSVPVNQLGDMAAQILFKKIREKDFDIVQHVALKPQLVIRDTTKSVE